jgi:hypothetical protein
MFTATAFSSQDIVRDGLVLWLDANDKTSYPGSGTVWRDLSRGGSDGTLTNGPTFNSANGGSIVFDGVDDYVNLGSNINLTNNITYNTWIKTTSIVSHLIGAYNNASPFSGWSVGIGINVTAGKICFWSGGGWQEGNIVCNTNQWINIAVTFIGGVIDFYLNGIFKSTASSTLISPYAGNKFLGGRANDGQSPFSGGMSIVQIYNRVLSVTEILQNYNATKSRFGL